MDPTPYDADIIGQFASRLYRRAAWHTFKHSVRGLFVGGFIGVGAILALAYNAAPNLRDAYVGAAFFGGAVMAVLGAMAGYVIGRSQSLDMRFQAQTALCQREIERHLSRIAGQGQQVVDSEKLGPVVKPGG